MFEFAAEIHETDENLKLINEALKELKRHEVLIGIPDSNSPRDNTDGNGISNAELLYIHTNGSVINNIPARPVIEPAIKDDKENLGEILKSAMQEALDGDIEGMKRSLVKAGLRGENVSKAWFTNQKNGWVANSPATIEQKGSSRPLIDTGELRKAITHVVIRK